MFILYFTLKQKPKSHTTSEGPRVLKKPRPDGDKSRHSKEKPHVKYFSLFRCNCICRKVIENIVHVSLSIQI